MKNSKLSRLIPHTYLFLKKAVLLFNKLEDEPTEELLKKFIKKNFPYPNAMTKKEAENLEAVLLEFFRSIYYNPHFDFPIDDAVYKEIYIYFLLLTFSESAREYLTLLVPEKLKIKKKNEKEEIEKGVKIIVEYLILLSRRSKYPYVSIFQLLTLENFFLILLFHYKYPIKSANMLRVYFENLFEVYCGEDKEKKINENTIFKEVLDKVNAIIIVSEIEEELPYGFPCECEAEKD